MCGVPGKHTKKTTSFAKANLILLIVSLLVTAIPGITHAAIALHPMRVEFEARERSVVVTVINKNDYDATYRIYFENKLVNTDGSYSKLTDETIEGNFADKFIRYSPRQVTIKAGNSQSVRLLLRKPKDLPAGEYRSHLVFHELPSANDNSSNIESINREANQVGVTFVRHYKVSIPVLVRHGEVSVETFLSDIALKETDNRLQLDFTINRQGNRSQRGDIEVEYTSLTGKSDIIGIIRGLSVYYPNPVRNVSLPINITDASQLNGGKITVRYINPDSRRNHILAQQEIQLTY